MAATYTTLSAACALNDTQISVTSATGFASGSFILVDGEYMKQVGAAVGTVISVIRGQNGSAQKAHKILAPVMVAPGADIPAAQPGSTTNPAVPRKVMLSYGADGAITPPTVDSLIFLDKATAASMTLTSPSTLNIPDGVEVTIYSNTAAAHTVTYTPGFNANTTTSDVATFAATKGNSFTIISAQGLWGMKCASGVTLG
jgi:hypothetical protein